MWQSTRSTEMDVGKKAILAHTKDVHLNLQQDMEVFAYLIIAIMIYGKVNCKGGKNSKRTS